MNALTRSPDAPTVLLRRGLRPRRIARKGKASDPPEAGAPSTWSATGEAGRALLALRGEAFLKVGGRERYRLREL